MFEAGTPGLLPACPQCRGPTVTVARIEAPPEEFDKPVPTQTLKFQAIAPSK